MASLGFGSDLRRYYLKTGIDEVHGWLSLVDRLLISSLCEVQTAAGVSGAIGEIGVHHGKLFLVLYLNMHAGEGAFCIDVFERQELNLDQSGRGDEEVFLSNLKKFSGQDRVHIFKESSLNVGKDDIVAAVGEARLISIDGGHTSEATANDLSICDGALSSEGIVILDDYFNPSWPGVSEGVAAYLQAGPAGLAPFAIGENKVFFCRPGMQARYQADLATRCNELRQKSSEFHGYKVDIYLADPSLSALLGKTRWRRCAALTDKMEKAYASLKSRIGYRVLAN